MAEQIKGILLIFIAIVVALPLMIGMVSLITPQTQLSTATNEAINISSAIIDSNNINDSIPFQVYYSSSVTGNTPISSVVITNGTDTATISTDYALETVVGSFTLENSTYMLSAGDMLYVTYQYKDSSYMDVSFSRLIVGLIVGIASLILIAYLASWIMRMFDN